MSTKIPPDEVETRLRRASRDICAPGIKFLEAHAVAFIARRWAAGGTYEVELERSVKWPSERSTIDFVVSQGEALAGFEVKWGEHSDEPHYIVADMYKLLCWLDSDKKDKKRSAYFIWGRTRDPPGPGTRLHKVIKLLDDHPNTARELGDLEDAATTATGKWWTFYKKLKDQDLKREDLPLPCGFMTPRQATCFCNGGKRWKLRCVELSLPGD